MKLESWSTTSTSGKPSQDLRHLWGVGCGGGCWVGAGRRERVPGWPGRGGGGRAEAGAAGTAAGSGMVGGEGGEARRPRMTAAVKKFNLWISKEGNW